MYFCYIHGIIQPLPNSLEKPVDVYYVGFHKNYVDMRFITPADVARMHVYKCDTIDWASNFAKHMLGVAADIEPERDPISPWLDELLQAQANMNLDTEFKVSKSSKTTSAINTSSDAGVSTAE